MNSKRKDLQYASVFLLAVALTFLMGKGDNLWLVSWGDLIPSLFVLFIAGDCLHSSLLRIKRGEEEGGARWSTCFTFLVLVDHFVYPSRSTFPYWSFPVQR